MPKPSTTNTQNYSEMSFFSRKRKRFPKSGWAMISGSRRSYRYLRITPVENVKGDDCRCTENRKSCDQFS
ncbi:hypothetical protein RB195_016053 [Necator americanus]|uniref:Uncharacterized protein n=1 Tax=Necator americanus TaxID=51031 RepID=A0ABR1E8H0_NECAM